MIDPIIYSFNIGGLTITLRWYGLLVMGAIVVGTFIVDREFKRKGGDPDHIWNALVWVVPAALIGARLWYVINATAGGSRYYLDQPGRILLITEGGLHIFGGLILGGLTAYWYARRNRLDWIMLLDSVAPALLIGQAFARPANFINQELYGPPTDLPWGIPIEAENRIPPWDDMQAFPESTRFHPTFAYEMIWNLITGGILLWLSRKYSERLKPGTLFYAWLIAAGLGRFLIEAFRPDQPRIPGTAVSYSRVIAGLMAVAGFVGMLVRYEKLKLSFWPAGPESYRLPRRRKSSAKKASATRQKPAKKEKKRRRK